MLIETENYLKKYNAFDNIQNPYVEKIIKAIAADTVSNRMKQTIAVTQLIVFASQFKRNIALQDESTLVPINTISFILTGSGIGKDSSVHAARKCFKKSYELINKTAQDLAVQKAIDKATKENLPDPHLKVTYKPYIKPVPPIDIVPTTGPGFIQHINDIDSLDIGAGFMYTGEFADAFNFSVEMADCLTILSELYDLGIKSVKYTKSIENRSQEINGQPVSALFVGAPDYILYDQSTKKKFTTAFMSKLARRSFFCFTPEKIPEKNFKTINELFNHEKNINSVASSVFKEINEALLAVASFNLKYKNKPISLTEKASELFTVYKRYNQELSLLVEDQNSLECLTRKHFQWKALKLAGAFCLLECKDKIEDKHYVHAIQFCESLKNDIALFEKELNKEPHEHLVDLFHTKTLVDNKTTINTHILKKRSLMPNTSKSNLEEMASLCCGYDEDGIYSVINDYKAIQYQKIEKTNTLGVSYKIIDLSGITENSTPEEVKKIKTAAAKNSNSGFFYGITTFKELTQLFAKDTAFSPFKFKDGVRANKNIINGIKFLVFDIDNSSISAEEAHILFENYNHHIVLTSDFNNDYKFRVLFELDSEVSISSSQWFSFYENISEDLGLNTDILPQSQIYFTFKDRPYYSVTDANCLNVKKYLLQAKESKSIKSVLRLTNNQKVNKLENPQNTFHYAYNAKDGRGSIELYKAIQHAKDLGADLAYIEDLLDTINNHFWEHPMKSFRLDNLKKQARRILLQN